MQHVVNKVVLSVGSYIMNLFYELQALELWVYEHVYFIFPFCNSGGIWTKAEHLYEVQQWSVSKFWEIYYYPFRSSGKKIILKVIFACQCLIIFWKMPMLQCRKWHHSHNNYCWNLQCCSAAIHLVKRQTCVYHYHITIPPYFRHWQW